MEFVEAPARVQRYAEPVLAFEHQTVEAGRVDPGHGIARDDLPGGDVGRRVDLELQRDGQFGQIDVVAFQHHVVPRAAFDDFAANVLLTALAERRRQIRGFYAETRSQELAIAGNVRDKRHAAAAHVLEHYDRALARVIEF